MAEFISLYSGSSGNCNVVRAGDRYLMIDMGKSCKITVEALKKIGLPIANCDGILITHEHSDHVKGLRVFLKKHRVPVYGAADTLDMLWQNELVPEDADLHTITYAREDIGAFAVCAFQTSHDVPCVGYRVQTPDARIMAIATDLGHLTPVVEKALVGCDLVALESNYDPYRLQESFYPEYLKTRIRSNRGHLCNEMCSEKIVQLLQAGCKKFALCHLSKENNTPELALHAVLLALAAHGMKPDADCVVQAQYRDEVSPAITF
ncbi:MAG: MBL fold metallo-hydrolase [Faecalibacterium sp.]